MDSGVLISLFETMDALAILCLIIADILLLQRVFLSQLVDHTQLVFSSAVLRKEHHALHVTAAKELPFPDALLIFLTQCLLKLFPPLRSPMAMTMKSAAPAPPRHQVVKKNGNKEEKAKAEKKNNDTNGGHKNLKAATNGTKKKRPKSTCTTNDFEDEPIKAILKLMDWSDGHLTKEENDAWDRDVAEAVEYHKFMGRVPKRRRIPMQATSGVKYANKGLTKAQHSELVVEEQTKKADFEAFCKRHGCCGF